MTEDAKGVAATGVIIGFVAGLFFGAILFGLLHRGTLIEFRQKAVTGGAAYYHPQTGEFTWNDDAEEE